MGAFLCLGRFRFPCFLSVLRGLSPRRRVAVAWVASPAFCILCCLGSPRLPETQAALPDATRYASQNITGRLPRRVLLNLESRCGVRPSSSEEGITCPRVRTSGSQRGCRARVIGSHPRVAQTSEFVRPAPKPAGVRRQSALEVIASSQTKISQGVVRPAQEREELTALAADTSQAVSRCVHETGGEESSGCLMRSQV